jgi:hypothetical protein
LKYVQHKKTRWYRKRKRVLNFYHIRQEGGDKRRSTAS